jgi:hypothetical protein
MDLLPLIRALDSPSPPSGDELLAALGCPDLDAEQVMSCAVLAFCRGHHGDCRF